jgi:hypothetical protein
LNEALHLSQCSEQVAQSLFVEDGDAEGSGFVEL